MAKDAKDAKEAQKQDDFPINFPHIDESELLADARSPRFLRACHKLKIDPIELCPRPLEEFQEKNITEDIQKVRFAMYERARMHKWKSLNECRFSMPSDDPAQARSKSAEPSASHFNESWVTFEVSKTQTLSEKGRTEVFKSVRKKLKDIASEGRMVVKESNDRERRDREARQAAEHRRKELIRKHAQELQRKKEKMKKDQEEMDARERQFKEMDQASKARQQAIYEAWEKESQEKQQKQQEHFERVQANVARANEEQAQRAQKILADLQRKEEQTKKKQEQWIQGGDSGVQEKAIAAERRRQDLLRNQAEIAKHMLAEHKRIQQEADRKVAERAEKQKEQSRERKQKESQTRKRIADIQKKKKEILKDRAESIMGQMKAAEERSEHSKAERQRQLDLKAEIDRLRYQQAQENMEREKMRKRAAARELMDKHEETNQTLEQREETIKDLLKERQLQATAIRLQKAQLQEEIFQIKVHNSWNKANVLLREYDPQ